MKRASMQLTLASNAFCLTKTGSHLSETRDGEQSTRFFSPSLTERNTLFIEQGNG